MGTTTHVSAGRRRRQRLRRTVLVATLLVVSAGTAGYAAWHGDDPHKQGAAQAASKASGREASKPGKPAMTKPKVRSTGSTAKGSAKGTGGPAFAPVVTDRIPAPTTSLALS